MGQLRYKTIRRQLRGLSSKIKVTEYSDGTWLASNVDGWKTGAHLLAWFLVFFIAAFLFQLVSPFLGETNMTFFICCIPPTIIALILTYQFYQIDPFDGYDPPFIIFKDKVVEAHIRGEGWYYIGDLKTGTNNYKGHGLGIVMYLEKCNQIHHLGYTIIPSLSRGRYVDKECYFIYVPARKQITHIFNSKLQLADDVKMFYREVEDVPFPSTKGPYKRINTFNMMFSDK